MSGTPATCTSGDVHGVPFDCLRSIASFVPGAPRANAATWLAGVQLAGVCARVGAALRRPGLARRERPGLDSARCR